MLCHVTSFPSFRYSKEEELSPGGDKMMSFTYLLIGNQTVLPYYKNTHRTIHIVEGFSRLKLNKNFRQPLQIQLQPDIWILEKIKDK